MLSLSHFKHSNCTPLIEGAKINLLSTKIDLQSPHPGTADLFLSRLRDCFYDLLPWYSFSI